MGRPFLEKFADVQWEVNEDHLQKWKDGKTGYPIVDAAMRSCNARGMSGTQLASIHHESGTDLYRMDGESGEDGGCLFPRQGSHA